ncbi:MAG: hypothetical protein E8D42_11720 [Nitrospira sp.]|nr:MAG: hypothetical protein E8D42_11720 [Nitrospira sp.]
MKKRVRTDYRNGLPMSGRSEKITSRSAWLLHLLCVATLCGCVAKQSDLKEAQHQIYTLSKYMDAQDKKISKMESFLREQELPQVRMRLEYIQHQAGDLYMRQEEIKLILNRFEKLHEAEKAGISQRLDLLMWL